MIYCGENLIVRSFGTLSLLSGEVEICVLSCLLVEPSTDVVIGLSKWGNEEQPSSIGTEDCKKSLDRSLLLSSLLNFTKCAGMFFILGSESSRILKQEVAYLISLVPFQANLVAALCERLRLYLFQICLPRKDQL